jgi:hypothetical protein
MVSAPFILLDVSADGRIVAEDVNGDSPAREGVSLVGRNVTVANHRSRQVVLPVRVREDFGDPCRIGTP